MSDKPWRVITPFGTAWTARFLTEEAAWGRVLSLNGKQPDTRETRTAMLADGWRVVEIAPVDAGTTL